MIGVLGGMGPAATIDFLAKLIRLTGAERDQDHLPVAAISDPRVPDRTSPILEGRGRSPLPAMRASVEKLERIGATCIAIPCHTAHHWYDRLAETTELPILHIADAALADIARHPVRGRRIGLLATAATLKAGFYQDRLSGAGHAWLAPTTETMAADVLPAIALVKRDRADLAAPLVARAIDHLVGRGAGLILLACTELPLVPIALGGGTPCIDATESLARACIAHHRAASG